MATFTNKIFLTASLILLAPQASANDIRLTCGKAGVLRAIETSSGRAEFKADLEAPIEAQTEVACQKIGECLSSFPAVQKIASETGEILKARGIDNDLSAFFDVNRFFQFCKYGSRPSGELAPIPETIKLRSSDGINRGKSGNYYSDEMAKVVRHALLAGTDPYLALAITTLENPATSKDSGYAKSYGGIPVDATAAYTAMGCLPGGRNYSRYLNKDDLNAIAASSRKIAELSEKAYSYTYTQDGYIQTVKPYVFAQTDIKYYTPKIEILEKKVSDPTTPDLEYWKEKLENAKSKLSASKEILAKLEKVAAVQEYEKVIAELEATTREYSSLHNKLASQYPDDPAIRQEFEAELACASSTNCRGVIRAPKEPLKLNYVLFPEVSKPRPAIICAKEDTAQLAASPLLANSFGEPSDKCCAEITAAPSGKEDDFLKATLGAKYLREEIQNCAERSGKSLAYCIQKYNGLGCFGCTEKMKNDCFYKLQMAKTPVYGARAADLMLDALMDNPEINRMVQIEQKRMGLAPTSIFCLREKKPGTYTLNSATYANSLRSMLGGRAACKKYFR